MAKKKMDNLARDAMLAKQANMSYGRWKAMQEPVKEGLFRALRDDNNINGANFARVKRHIDNAPTVDAVEVVHASWIEDGYYGNPFVCSHCGCEGCYSGDYHNKQYYYTNYCPNCGAKMDGDSNG